ncbi:hypothetical protein CAP35_00555 [Chitinophagaceae bacterium IBVUCB1]|nr:hypothetical protein CAP35_00555 [Chitinophagaceae bacterium IBVUCB1]
MERKPIIVVFVLLLIYKMPKYLCEPSGVEPIKYQKPCSFYRLTGWHSKGIKATPKASFEQGQSGAFSMG